MRVGVCIATYGRPDGLNRLLEGLRGLTFPSGPAPAVTVIVVDNNPDAAAQALVARHAATGFPFDLRHAHEPRRGISQARNRALRESAGQDFIAFIDDDEVPRPDWLDALLAAQRATGADAVAGAVLARLPDGAPAWAVRGGFYQQRAHDELEPIGYAYTNNSLLRRSVVDELGLAFDEALGLTGGEDLCFFSAIADAGRKIVWTNRAVVEEWIPESRTRVGWLLRRWYRTGSGDALLTLTRRPGLGGKVRGLAGGGARVVLGGMATAPMLLAVGPGRHLALRRMKTVCRGLGMIGAVFGMHYQEYRDQPKA